jgi:hypothetical protein
MQTILAVLVITKKITPEEADKLVVNLAGMDVPNSWLGVVGQVESVLERSFDIHNK